VQFVFHLAFNDLVVYGGDVDATGTLLIALEIPLWQNRNGIRVPRMGFS